MRRGPDQGRKDEDRTSKKRGTDLVSKRGRTGSSFVRIRPVESERESDGGGAEWGTDRAAVRDERRGCSGKKRVARAHGKPHRRVRAGRTTRRGGCDCHRPHHRAGHVRLGTDERPRRPPGASEAERPSPAAHRRAIERDGPGYPRAGARRGAIDEGLYWQNDEDASGYAAGGITVLADREMDEGRPCREVLIETAMERRPTDQRVRTYCRDGAKWRIATGARK